MSNIERLKNGLFYTDEEILIQYRESADKKEQIKILAELNLCSEKDIRVALVRAGLDFRNLPRTSKKDKENNKIKNGTRYTPIDHDGKRDISTDKILENQPIQEPIILKNATTADGGDNKKILHTQSNIVDESKFFNNALYNYTESLKRRKELTNEKILQLESDLSTAKNELINIDQQLEILNSLLILVSTTN